MTYTRSIIVDEEDYSIEHVRCQIEKPADIVVFTFTEYGNRNKEGNGFGGDFLLASGFDIITVKTIKNEWFAGFTSKYAKYITQYMSDSKLAYTRRCGYGSSMGGYAALKFSNTLSLDCILAISPQFDISQDWDTQWKHAAGSSKDWPTLKADEVSPLCKYFIAYDPHNKDSIHYSHYSNIIPRSQIHPLRVPASGHPSGYVLNDTRVLKTMAQACFVSTSMPSDWRSQMRRGRTLSARYFHNLAELCLAHRKLRWAELSSLRAVALDAYHPEYNIRLALIYERKGNWDGMFVHAAAATAANPWHPHMAGILARALAHKGMKKEALHHAERACSVSVNPSFIRLRDDIAAS